MSVSDYMIRNPVTVPSTMKLTEVVEIMAARQIDSIMVTKDGAPRGS